jgi:hypothetical protein
MPVHGKARSPLVLLFFLAVVCWAGALANTATAAPLEGVTGAVTEGVGEPVREVVETVSPPVQEITEAATGPVEEATQVTPPVQEVTEAATAPVEAVKETVKPPVKAVTETVAPPAKAVTEAVRHPSASPPVKLPSVPKAPVAGTKGAKQVVQGTVEDVAGTVSPASKRVSSSPGPDPTSTKVGSPQDVADQGSVAPRSADRTGLRQGNSFIPSPAINGSTGAPLPKWVAYVWPAIALLRPGLTDLVDHWEAAVLIALGTNEGFGETTGTGPVVAGVHATGGRSGQADSSSPSPSSSPFSKITTAVGDFPYNGAGAALAYLLIVAIMVIALYGAVRWEIARSRREGR